MTGVQLATAIAVTTVAGLLLWTAMVRAQTRISPATAPDTVTHDTPTGMTTRVCDSVTCCGPVPHVLLPRGAAVCARCGTESPTPYQTP